MCISLPHCPPFRCHWIPHWTQQGEVILLSARFSRTRLQGEVPIPISHLTTRGGPCPHLALDMVRGSPPLSVHFLAHNTRGGHSPFLFPPTQHDKTFPYRPVTMRRGRGTKMRVLEDVPPFLYIYITSFYLIYFFLLKAGAWAKARPGQVRAPWLGLAHDFSKPEPV